MSAFPLAGKDLSLVTGAGSCHGPGVFWDGFCIQGGLREHVAALSSELFLDGEAEGCLL